MPFAEEAAGAVLDAVGEEEVFLGSVVCQPCAAEQHRAGREVKSDVALERERATQEPSRREIDRAATRAAAVVDGFLDRRSVKRPAIAVGAAIGDVGVARAGGWCKCDEREEERQGSLQAGRGLRSPSQTP